MTKDDGRKVVVIADDQPSLRLLVSATITSDDYYVVQAADGKEAWDLIVRHRPAIALLDVQMPGLTGVELTRMIKADPNVASTHVILLSAKTQEADVRAGMEAGADRYMTKPFSPLELLTVVERALE